MEFIGTENKNPYIVVGINNASDPNVAILYEYKNESFNKIFTFTLGEVHLIHDEILAISKDRPSDSYSFQRIDIETREVTDISYSGEIKEIIDKGGFFDVVDDNDDIIVVHHEYTVTIDGEDVSEQYLYVIDKDDNEITKMYDLSEYSDLLYITVDSILLENETIILIANSRIDSEDIVSFDYKNDTVTTETLDQYGLVQFLNGKYCIVTKDHRNNNTCRTIPEGKETFLINYTMSLYETSDILYDGEYLYHNKFNSIEIYNLDGVLVQTNIFHVPQSSILYDDGELLYIDEHTQGFIFIRRVFEVVYYDILENKETNRSKPKAIPSKPEEFTSV